MNAEDPRAPGQGKDAKKVGKHQSTLQSKYLVQDCTWIRDTSIYTYVIAAATASNSYNKGQMINIYY